MTALKDRFLKIKAHPQFSQILLAVLAVVIAILLQFVLSGETSSPITSDSSEKVSADTFIPAGFVLVPIEIQNLVALDSILGQQGVVDLFLPPTIQRKKPILIKKRAKVLRAPHNPSQFAALVPENEASQLLASNAPLFAVVQNPQNRNAVKMVEQQLRHRRIIFHDRESENGH